MNALKVLVLLVAIAATSPITSANAQVYGTYAYCNGGVWRFGGCGGSIAPFAIPPGMAGQQFVVGQRIHCSAKDRFASAAVDSFVGAAAAAGADLLFNRGHDTGRFARGGALMGAAYGASNFGCDALMVDDGDIVQRQVAASQAGYRQQAGYQQQGGTAGYVQRSDVEADPSTCIIDGVTKPRGISREDCRILREAAKTSTPERRETTTTYTRATVPAERPAVNGADLWKWRNGLATASNPGTCVVEKLTGEGKPTFCSELKELPRIDGETREQWAMRAESF